MNEATLGAIARNAQSLDQTGAWPTDDLAALAAGGAMRWAIPRPHGEELSPLELHLRYEQLASASLALALIVSQRDSAVQMIEQSDGFADRELFLARFAANEIFATIGIAQLTTSRQGGPPALRAEANGEGFIIDGLIPWSTGANKSDFIVAGAALPDKQHILFCLPTDREGVRIEDPLPLVALRSTWTTQVHCRHVKLGSELILRGPTENVLAGRRKSIPIGQVFLALGLCRSALDLIAAHKSDAGDRSRRAFESELEMLRNRVLHLCSPAGMSDAPTEAAVTRADVNDFAVRVTHAAIALYKGTALLADHPAQRLAREAMFLLVWSCPGPVIDCTLDRLIEC